jgi:hypothetical protein
LKDIFKFINGKNCLMDRCKIVGICQWKYYNICHIDGIRFYFNKVLKCNYNIFILMIVSLPFTINVINLTIPSFVSWFRILSQYGANIVFFLSFGRAMQYPSKFHGECKYPKMMQVLHLNSITLFKWHFTINLKNFAIPLFIWINMSGMI